MEWHQLIVTTYTYDNAGRATGYNYSDGVTPAVIITLDFFDRQSSITDAAGTRSFSYNANNQLGNETNPSIMNGMITYAYDNAGRRTGMVNGGKWCHSIYLNNRQFVTYKLFSLGIFA